VHYSVQRVSIGLTQSKSTVHYVFLSLIVYRLKEKLRSGEMAVSGDQWPIFLYHGYTYDPDDPWNGLFRSNLLVSVGSTWRSLDIYVLIVVSGVQTYIHVPELR
jgi:hypothetical protein